MWIQESETNEDGNVCNDLHDAFSLRKEFVDMLLRNQSQNVVDEEVDVRYQQGQVIPGREVTVASWLGLVKDALFLKRPYDVVCCTALFSRMEKVLVENFGVILKLRHHIIGDALMICTLRNGDRFLNHVCSALLNAVSCHRVIPEHFSRVSL